MERASLKKDGDSSKLSNQATANTTSGPTQSLLVNDGNFLARFKAMQEEAKKKEDNEDKAKNAGKLSINLSGVKKKTAKSATASLPKPSAFFETQEEANEVLTIEEDVLKAADELAMKVAKEGDEAEALARMQYQNNNKYKYVYSSGDIRDIQ